MKSITFRKAFTATIPVLLGYLTVGTAFGLMFRSFGYNVLWSAFMALFCYSGSMQFIAAQLLKTGVGLAEIALMAILVQSRHLVYGFSMFDKFEGMGKHRLYMMFALTDETYALIAGLSLPPDVDRKAYYFLIALLNQCYWVLGCILGSVAGNMITFSTKGIDFAMTALFLVILTDQFRQKQNRIPALVGGGCALLALFIFGSGNMLIPAMAAMLPLLFAARPLIEKSTGEEKSI